MSGCHLDGTTDQGGGTMSGCFHMAEVAPDTPWGRVGAAGSGTVVAALREDHPKFELPVLPFPLVKTKR